MAHLLLEKTFKFDKKDDPHIDARCHYDYAMGAWMINENGQEVFLVKSEQKPRPLTTKKADIETGEDQKGY